MGCSQLKNEKTKYLGRCGSRGVSVVVIFEVGREARGADGGGVVGMTLATGADAVRGDGGGVAAAAAVAAPRGAGNRLEGRLHVAQQRPVEAVEKGVRHYLLRAAARAQSLLRVFRQEALDEVRQQRGAVVMLRKLQRLVYNILKRLSAGRSLEGGCPESELVAEDPQRPPVDGRRVAVPDDDLGREVVLGADKRVGTRDGARDQARALYTRGLGAVHARGAAALLNAVGILHDHVNLDRRLLYARDGVPPSVGEVKVGDDGVAAVEQHVLRLQVAVDEAQEVEVLEGGDDLGDVKPDVLLLQRALTVQQLVQVAALAAAEEVVDVLGGADGAVAKRQKGVVHVPQHLILRQHPVDLIPAHHILFINRLQRERVSAVAQLHQAHLPRRPAAQFAHQTKVGQPQRAAFPHLSLQQLVAPVVCRVHLGRQLPALGVQLLKRVVVHVSECARSAHHIVQSGADAGDVKQRVAPLAAALVQHHNDHKLARAARVLHGAQLDEGGEDAAIAADRLRPKPRLRIVGQQILKLARRLCRHSALRVQEHARVATEDVLTVASHHAEKGVGGKHDGTLFHPEVAD
mmetsp:Transcript_24861/g.44283  ORF Transcript_24861/g.44283 Transcript_24861/m.44283 type:complete len:576 (-) Transcript_24861:96-1823(-)